MKTNKLIHLGSRTRIMPSDILMLKADINYTIVILNDGSKIISSTTMGIIEKRLENYHFFRPNRSVILNMEYVVDYEEKKQSGSFGNILLINNEKVPLSRRKSEAFFKIFQ